MPRLSRLLRLAFAALLVSAWQVALLHPLQHVDSGGAFVHIPGGGSKAPGEKNGSRQLCDAIAAVTACVASTPSVLVAARPAAAPTFAHEAPRAPRAPTLAYRSQAPPSLL